MKKPKNKQLRKYILWAAMAAVVLFLAVMPLLATPEEEAEGPQASILTGTAEIGSIELSLRGGGTLEASRQENVELPSGVKITEFLVTNGDMVTEGTPLAAVDRVTLMESIVWVQETLEYLQEEMKDVQDNKISSYIKATAGGRIKKIYAREGESVQEVMLRDGALAILSLDGLMAVDIERDMPLTTGETVCVTFSDDTEVDGRVELNLNGRIVITIRDEGYAMGETVTVTTEDGTRVGKGELYVHNAWTATGFSGTVSSIYAKEETTVYSGSTLMTLTDREFTAELDRLADEHREYEQLLQEMIVMYENGAILAPCDGIVSGIDTESAHLLAAEEGAWELQLLTNTQTGREKGWTIVFLSDVTGEPAPETEAPETQPPETDPSPEEPVPGNPDVEAPEDWENLCTRDDTCTAETHQEGCPKAEGGEEEPGEGWSGWAATVLTVDTENGITWVMKNPDPITVSDPENPGAIDTAAMTEVTSISLTAYTDGGAMAAGDTVLLLKEGGALKLTVAQAPQGGGQMPAMGGFGAMGGMSSGAAVQEPAFEPYALEGSSLMTITAREEMTITITLDQQDIAKVHQGQPAIIEVTALRGQTFEGEVTGVSRHGTNSGGSSKYTVEVTLPVAENMLSGMTATVSIPLYTKMDILTIPVAALVENGTETQVYTALDSETGELASPVTVTTGISDGETVEILSGLSSGDSCYYSYYDTLEVSTEVEKASRFGR